jgi:hypothetical protein
MSEVFWKRNKHDPTDVVWTDLRDLTVKLGIRGWVVTYREYHGAWLVMWNPKIFSNRSDQLINRATTSEEQLRNDLKLQYLLMRGET